MANITYYRKPSRYNGDITKNTSLNGCEIDDNFFFLESHIIKSFELLGKTLIITLFNGSQLTVDTSMIAKNDVISGDAIKINYVFGSNKINLSLSNHIENCDSNDLIYVDSNDNGLALSNVWDCGEY